MTPSAALIVPQSPSVDISYVASASLAAYMKAQLPGFQLLVCRVGASAVARFDLELQLQPADPKLLLFWYPLDLWPGFEMLVVRLRAMYPSSLLGIFGPGVSEKNWARHALGRYPGLALAFRGGCEKSLTAVFSQLETGLCAGDLSKIPGISYRQKGRIRHNDDHDSPLEVEELVSPWCSRLIHRVQREDIVWAEVQRAPKPFSPLPLELQQGTTQVFSRERLKKDFTEIFRHETRLLELGPGPLDTTPFFLATLLDVLEEVDCHASVRLELRKPPDSNLLDRLRRANVTRVIFTHPPSDSSHAGPGVLLNRRKLQAIQQMGIDVALRIPLGRPLDTREQINRRLDAYLAAKVRHILLEPIRLWPGHPMRKKHARQGGPSDTTDPANQQSKPPAGGSKPQKEAPSPLVHADAPSWEVISTPDLSSEALSHLLLQAPLFARLYPTFPSTIRLFADVLGFTPSRLVDSFAEWPEAGSPEVWGQWDEDIWFDRLSEFIRSSMHRVGKVDFIPILITLADYELWKHTPREALKVPETIPCDLDALDEMVLSVSPAYELRSFPRDVIRLEASRHLTSAPVRQTHVLLRPRGSAPAHVVELSELQVAILGMLDGIRSVGEVSSFLDQGSSNGQAVVSEVYPAVQRMLERGYVLAIDRLGGTPEGLPEGGVRKILPFVRRPSTDDSRSDESSPWRDQES